MSTAHEHIEIIEAVIVVEEEPKKPGRPTNPSSKRQQAIRQKEILTEEGIAPKLGRPVNVESKNYQAKNKGEGKKGRPRMTDEEKEAARLLRLEAALVLTLSEEPIVEITTETNE